MSRPYVITFPEDSKGASVTAEFAKSRSISFPTGPAVGAKRAIRGSAVNIISRRELALHMTQLKCDKGATLTTDSILLSALATAIHAHVSEEQRRSAATSSAEAASVNADRSLRSSKLSANEDQRIVVADIKGLLKRMHSVYHASIQSMVQSICRICHMLQDKMMAVREMARLALGIVYTWGRVADHAAITKTTMWTNRRRNRRAMVRMGALGIMYAWGRVADQVAATKTTIWNNRRMNRRAMVRMAAAPTAAAPSVASTPAAAI